MMYYKCGDEQQASDLAQEAFIKLWEKCREIEFSTAKGFLFTVAKNLFLNQVKHKKVVFKFEQATKVHNEMNDPEFLMRYQEFDSKLQEAIGQLSEKNREVFLMNRIEEIPYKEIAERLGITTKAVEKRMYTAISQLRKMVIEVRDRKI